MKSPTFALLVVLLSVCAFGQEVETEETITVYAVDERPVDRVNTNTIVITAAEIEKYGWRSVSDVLHKMPGMSIARSGGDGAQTSIFTRGAKSENTLFLLDGARINDTSGVGRGFNPAYLSTHNVERIEIVLGPQNTLHGTDASAGVVNIITKKGGEETAGQISAEVSDEDTTRLNASVGGTSGNMNYQVAGEFSDAASISARGDADLFDVEEDASETTNISARFGWTLDENSEANVILNSVDNDLDIDAFDSDDPNYTSEYQLTTISLNYRRASSDKRLSYGVFVDRSETDRATLDLEDPAHPDTSSEGDFSGESLRAELRGRYQVSDNANLALGLSHEQEDAESESISRSSFGAFVSAFSGDSDTTSLFAMYTFDAASGFDGEFGARYIDHSTFGDETTYQAGLGYTIPNSDTRLRVSHATGFKAPSLFQLLSSFGNLDLTPETSTATELGFATSFAEGRGTFGANWYLHEYEDLIEFFTDPNTFISFYINIDEAESEGIETYVSYATESWSLYASFEDLSAENTSNPSNAVPLIRRFDNKATIRAEGQIYDNLRANLDVLFYGDSLDTDFSTFPSSDVTLDNYTLVNLGIRWAFGESLDLTARGENVMDEDYTQVLGYNSIGRRLFLGAAWRF